MPKGQRGVRIAFQKTAAAVLLSDFELWHYVLNDWYLPRSEKDAAAFEASRKLTHSDPFPKPWSVTEKRIVAASWQKIFDMSFDDPYVTTKASHKSIQATFWELRMEEVLQVDAFTAR